MTFVAQQEVAILGSETPFRRGVFLALVNPTIAAIKLQNGRLEQVPVASLISVDKAVTEEKKIHEEQLRLEQQYAPIYEEIAVKMRAAADALREAGKLAKQVRGTDSWNRGAPVHLTELHEECRPFLDAMDAAGWSTSSLTC